ncbi:hypothetical protein ACE41V_24080, partial [Shigella sonnei]
GKNIIRWLLKKEQMVVSAIASTPHFHRLISLLQMPLRGHLCKHNLPNNRQMVRASFYQNSAQCNAYTWRTKCHLLKLFPGSIFIMTG